MKLQSLFLLAAASIAAASVAAPLTGRDVELPAELVGRSCVSGCKCRTGLKAGLYCGTCVVDINGSTNWPVSTGWSAHHIYQCGSSGSCCDYGTASDCSTTHGRCAEGSTIGG
jgi:hypothetical protein